MPPTKHAEFHGAGDFHVPRTAACSQLHYLLDAHLLSFKTSLLLLLLLLQGAAKQALLDMRSSSAWVTPASGVLLVAGGTYALLTRLLPAV